MMKRPLPNPSSSPSNKNAYVENERKSQYQRYDELMYSLGVNAGKETYFCFFCACLSSKPRQLTCFWLFLSIIFSSVLSLSCFHSFFPLSFTFLDDEDIDAFQPSLSNTPTPNLIYARYFRIFSLSVILPLLFLLLLYCFFLCFSHCFCCYPWLFLLSHLMW